MGKRKVIFLCLAVGLLLTAVIWAVFRDREQEPMYNGRTLSEWADFSSQDWKESSKAIRHMGTNTFPIILKWLRFNPSPWKVRLFDRLSLEPDWMRPAFLVTWLDDAPAKDSVVRAFRVIELLQEDAAPLAPELLHLSYSKAGPVIWNALQGFSSMGTNGLPHLLRVIRDPAYPHRGWAIGEIGRVLARNPGATNAMQAISECLRDQDPRVREQANLALAYWPTQHNPRMLIEEARKRAETTNEGSLRVGRDSEIRASNAVANDPPR